MDEAFWHQRWANGQIGFHEGAPNELLARHLDRLALRAGGRILVPLCGKAHDVHFLVERGFTVVGIELSRLAVDALFAEAGLRPEESDAGPLRRLVAGALTVFVGNVFDLDRATLGPVDAVYDRAALIALPPEMRADYARHVTALTDAAPQLLVTVEYDPVHPIAPPFSVEEAEIAALYAERHVPTLLERYVEPGGIKGLAPGNAAAWLLQPASAERPYAHAR